MSNPAISVVMSVYNGEKYLKEAIDSILSQTYADFEFIIIDDGSTDKSLEIISSYHDQRIVLVQNEINIGLTKSLNKGIRLAKGKYIARMDADDISLPLRFEKQVLFMQEHPDIDICGTWYTTFEQHKYLQKLPLTHEQIKADLLFYTPIAHPTILMKKNIFKKYQYPENFLKAQDYALWIELIDKYKFSNLPESLLMYRTHLSQASIAESSVQKELALKALQLFLDKIDCKLSQESITIHARLFLGETVPLTITEQWLKDIIKINANIHFFDNESLHKSLFYIWKSQCSLPRKNAMMTIRRFYLSPLFLKGSLSLFEHIKFIIRIFIGIK